jgi:chlorite dismutase
MSDGPQFVRFLFCKLDPGWRRLSPTERGAHKTGLVTAARALRARLLLRTYSLVGTRGDADLLFWQVADDLDALHRFHAALLRTELGAWLHTPYSYVGVLRRSIYELPADTDGTMPRMRVAPQTGRHLFVYPFVKTRDWYRLPLEERRALMAEHIATARRFPGVRSNTAYSFGLDDQEFVVAFEADDAAEFAELVEALRETAASAYTLRDTPTFACLQMSLAEALDALGGADDTAADEPRRGADGLTDVGALSELPERAGRRVYLGADAIALFRVDGCIYAVGDRCSHGRASLSEGTLDTERRTLRCPWHDGEFDLATGEPVAGPPCAPIATYRVRLDGDRILVG